MCYLGMTEENLTQCCHVQRNVYCCLCSSNYSDGADVGAIRSKTLIKMKTSVCYDAGVSPYIIHDH